MSILKKGILVVSFGTSILETLKSCIENTEQEIRNKFKGYEVRRAFTSGIIIRKLKREMGIEIDTVAEALLNMKNEGFSEVYVQPLHIMPGDEYDKIVLDVKKYGSFFDKLVVGRPVLYRKDDYVTAAKALENQLPLLKQNEAVVLMGHGSSHPGNAIYAMFQYVLEDMGMKNIFIGTVEGYPVIENIIPKLRDNKIEKVILMPFMVVAGDHALNDMAGDDSNSWKEILKSKGFEVSTYIHGLGENRAFQRIYVQHVEDCINGNPLMNTKIKVLGDL
ncbi:Sirohydrochlorin cobaltochelatase [Clostridium luticellarii]|uniref:Sirohydrochlorin cobaltochelatase n=1 Tax=Clostridium luticellarii TaxID=1691940 RepID=A0A2T0BML5_9CLOT|nr:sirohydrochlorin cobaltochelatase [Clostridium luticellarii]PRR85106.1 Sirohydrochlorin cobaltochelatase [Clostridium luticellarii]